MDRLDCVVVGAGWYGLAAAKQFHHTNPKETLAVLESASSIGGTWADHRIYPGLKSNNQLGSFEYPDFPFEPSRFDVEYKKHIPGEKVNEYLKAYAANFGIEELVRLDTKVVSAEHQEDDIGGWVLTISGQDGVEKKVYARRMVLATGMTSEAFMPHFAGQEDFGKPLFHSKDFLQNKETLETAKSATVFGANKSGWDAVYAYATAGVKVHWIIRSTGHGPCWMAPPFVTPLKQWIEMLASKSPGREKPTRRRLTITDTRFLTWFSPCIWGDNDGYTSMRSSLHGTALGRGIVGTFWGILGNDVMTLCNFDGHPETKKLKPRLPAMYAGDSFSILNYDTDFFELVKSGKVEIHTSDIDHLSAGKVHLTDGTEFETDSFLANTGWKHTPPMKFLPEGIEAELGLPHAPVENAPAEDLGNQKDLIAKADEEIFTRFPMLKTQPEWNNDYVPVTETKGVDSKDAVTPTKDLTSYMLHRFMVPPSERFLRTRDTAFTGMVGNFSNTITAHIGGLWISAFFSGKLAKDPGAAVDDKEAMDKLRYDTVLLNRFGKWRYPVDWGNRKPSFIFDAVPYLDMLQNDLGLKPHRKGGFWAEMWSGYIAKDYKNVNDEWEAAYGDKAIESKP